MFDLNFEVERAEAVTFAAAPLLNFKLLVRQAAARATPIHTVVLRCQVRIEPGKRRYSPEEQKRLLDLFGSPSQWMRTLRPMLWTHTSAMLPAFTDRVVVDLPVPCSFDFNLGATKYFYALADGEAPLTLLFSGTIFYEGPEGNVQVAQVPWEKEATFRLPTRVWREMMEHYYPNSAWLCLRKDVFDRLYEFKSLHCLPSWEQALENLLKGEDAASSNHATSTGLTQRALPT
jgi:hypothetical protein